MHIEGSHALSEPLGQAALRLIARQGWKGLTLAYVAREAGLELAQLRDLPADGLRESIEAALDAACAGDLLTTPASQTPTQTQAQGPQSGVRDRLFDVAMARFDAMEAQRGALMRLWSEEEPVWAAGAWRAARRIRTAFWIARCANCPEHLPWSYVRAVGLARVLAKAEKAFAADRPDLAKTMAALDQGLRDAESFAQRWAKRGG